MEADVGNGQVDSIHYKLQPDANGNCPCQISRSQVPKANGTAPMAQTNSYNAALQDVINSGGANGGVSGTAVYTVSGVSGGGASNNTLYAEYKAANVFMALDVAGNEIGPADYSTTAGQTALKTIKTIRINVNLLGRNVDLQTGRRAVIPLAATSDVGNN